MALMSWCRQTAVNGFQKFLRPLVYQYRSEATTGPTVKYEDPWTQRWGYEDRYRRRGLLTHKDDLPRVSVLPRYRARQPWTQKRALMGQNDYIDILGSGEIHPVHTHYSTPRWLRGFHGDEMAILAKRRWHLINTGYPQRYPDGWQKFNQRIRFLYVQLNRRTRTPFVAKKV